MTYLEDRGERSAVVISEGEQMSRPGVGRAVALGSQTCEEFGLFRSEMAEGSEVEAHFHRTFSESFYLLSGRVELWNGDAWRGVSAGDLAYIPPRRHPWPARGSGTRRGADAVRPGGPAGTVRPRTARDPLVRQAADT